MVGPKAQKIILSQAFTGKVFPNVSEAGLGPSPLEASWGDEHENIYHEGQEIVCLAPSPPDSRILRREAPSGLWVLEYIYLLIMIIINIIYKINPQEIS